MTKAKSCSSCDQRSIPEKNGPCSIPVGPSEPTHKMVGSLGLGGEVLIMVADDSVDDKAHRTVGLLADEYSRHMDTEQQLDLIGHLNAPLTSSPKEKRLGTHRESLLRPSNRPAIDMVFQAWNKTRPSKGCQAVFSLVLIIALCGIANGACAQAPSPPAPTLDPTKEAANIKAASILDDDPADAKAVQMVCTNCHSSSQFIGTPRSSDAWGQVFGEMSQFGASPTDEQIDQIVRYFLRNLTIVNVNTSPAEELAPTLQVSDDVAAAIVSRRMRIKFSGIADLGAFPGVDPAKLVKLKNHLQF